ncbi:39S ribosomal protein L37, mitochondrial [Chrysoperla carnea]|uniref:39S ribosomal protein L37, mitochondrial n=1 Tax=Chrysoperla carnea TaxID=189513 RepID=UPI001D09752A|nr:39S ribosomal protein L37, mitochondrial [Chrysoperla carnea]
MRLNVVLYRQHIGRMFKKHWIIQGKRTPIDTTQDIQNELLKIRNDIKIEDPKQLFETEDKEQLLKVSTVDFKEINKKSVYYYDTSNNLKKQDRICHVFNDSNVLVGGVEQAKVLLNTLQLDTTDQNVLDKLLSNKQEKFNISKQLLYKQVEDAIKSSHLYDSEQVKLPVKKDPSRPAWNFPREYGISYQRKIELLTTKLLKICETFSENKNKYLLNNGTILTSFEKDSLLYQLDVNIDKLLTSNQRLSPLISDYQQYVLNNQTQKDQKQANNNSIYPLKCNISIPTTFYYDSNRNIYPINNANYIPHTLFVSYNKCNVHNLYETEVTDEQITSRTLMKLYATVSAYVQQFNLINKTTEDISEPITIQSVTSDGQFYEFGILQVNTINLENNIQNIWWTSDKINLFDQCQYLNGRPTCTSKAESHHGHHFNTQVIDYLFAFYNHH